MTSPTSYRAVLSDYQAIDILDSKAGTQFDPELTPEFKRMVSDASDWMRGEIVTFDGGEWLRGAGEFNDLLDVPPEMIEALRK